MKFTVETDDMRSALRSVSPHVSRVKDDTLYHRLRVDVDPENVTVTATNRATAAMAIASLWDSDDGEAGRFDLHPRDVKELLTLFRTARKTDDDQDSTMQFEVRDEYLVVTDISGLFPGKSLSVLRHPVDDQFPDVRGLVAKLMLVGAGANVDTLTVSGAELALFSQASGVYGQPLIVDAPASGRGSMLVSCGESFLGLLPQKRVDKETDAQARSWRDGWARRLTMEQQS